MIKGAYRKIIYVDDFELSLTTVKNRFKDRYEVYLAQSVRAMFDILKHVKPDVILLDVKMPELDGYDALKILKESERYADIPVIFLSAEYDKYNVEKGINMGADAYVVKPFSTEQLIEKIENAYYAGLRKKDLKNKRGNISPCILAVDDVSSVLRTIYNTLCGTYNVHTLSVPAKLGDLLENIKPDLFLLDYKMPEVNGFELIPVIRKFPEHKKTPIIFLTSEGTADFLKAAVLLGACDYIVKPFDWKNLREKVKKHLEQAGNIHE